MDRLAPPSWSLLSPNIKQQKGGLLTRDPPSVPPSWSLSLRPHTKTHKATELWTDEMRPTLDPLGPPSWSLQFIPPTQRHTKQQKDGLQKTHIGSFGSPKLLLADHPTQSNRKMDQSKETHLGSLGSPQLVLAVIRHTDKQSSRQMN